MSVPEVVGVQLAGSPDLPLLICGPSLGTSVEALWSATAALLGEDFHVVGWDLPGHGRNRAEVPEPFTIAELTEAVVAVVDGVLAERGETGGRFAYAGDSVGGAVGQQLLLDHPDRVSAAVLACTAARIGDEEGWLDRARTVRASGTPVMVEGSAQRWFAPGFLAAHADAAGSLLRSLQEADRHGYAAVCEALAAWDVRDRLAEVEAPVLAVAGAYDAAVPVAAVAATAHGVRDGRLVVLDHVAHQAPLEAPDDLSALVREHLARAGGERGSSSRAEAGMAVRRAVLGDAHVDRATAAVTDLTRDFQQLITEYAWGGIWTRPGLDRRTRSVITLTALVARGHHEELALHLRAARTNGLTDAEIAELVLQCAIYCGVPDANTAFRIAQRTLDELDLEDQSP